MKSLEESNNLSKKEKLLLERCKKVIKNVDHSAEIILYGSRARGEAYNDSDYDLLILVDGEVSLDREDFICGQLYPIELETGKVLSALVYSRQQWDTPLYHSIPLHKNVNNEGVII